MFALTTGEENNWLEKRKTVVKQCQSTKFCANIQKDLSGKNKFILQQEHVLDPINHFVQIFSYGIRCWDGQRWYILIFDGRVSLDIKPKQPSWKGIPVWLNTATPSFDNSAIILLHSTMHGELFPTKAVPTRENWVKLKFLSALGRVTDRVHYVSLRLHARSFYKRTQSRNHSRFI